jgi:hypothetical protein
VHDYRVEIFVRYPEPGIDHVTAQHIALPLLDVEQIKILVGSAMNRGWSSSSLVIWVSV